MRIAGGFWFSPARDRLFSPRIPFKFREKLAREAAAPLPKVTLSLPANTGGKALTKSNLTFNLPAGTANLAQENRTLNIVSMDPGFMPAEVTVTPLGVEIEVTAK